jgi:hypothetical protein
MPAELQRRTIDLIQLEQPAEVEGGKARTIYLRSPVAESSRTEQVSVRSSMSW